MVSKISETWEEEMYWKIFRIARFSLILPHDFHHRLILPKKFTKHMRTQLPEKVVLEVNGLTWNINLEKGKNDAILQGNGWQEFVKAYSLQKSDILLFEYDKHECFKVLFFDFADSCEKEASYFVRKDQQPNSNDSDDSDGEDLKDRNQGRNGNYILGRRRRRDSSRDCQGYSLDDYDKDEQVETPNEENSISAEDCNINTPKKVEADRARKVPSKFPRKSNFKVGEETTTMKKRQCISGYKSNRRPITEQEKNNALEKAREAFTQQLNSFFVIMRPTSVYNRFFMSIPIEWKPARIFMNREKVILRVKEKTWVCRVSLRSNRGGLEGAGWKRFALENYLEEYDVCLFVPTLSKDTRPVLDVSIFRVVPQVVQPSPVTPDDLEVNKNTSEDSSEGDGDFDNVKRNKHRKKSGRNVHNTENLCDEDELDESPDEERSSSEEDCTPKIGATLRGRESPSDISRKRKHDIAEITTLEENGIHSKSSARNITETDEEWVLKMAEETEAKYKNSFIAVMRPTSVAKRYFLSITKDWKLRRNLRSGQEVILQLKSKVEKTWPCTFLRSMNNVGLQSGWKRFVIDNKLEKFDVCLFVPAPENNEKCILDVIIFRVHGPAVV